VHNMHPKNSHRSELDTEEKLKKLNAKKRLLASEPPLTEDRETLPDLGTGFRIAGSPAKNPEELRRA